MSTNYMKLLDGDIEFYRDLAGARRLHRTLKRLESGIAQNGEWNVIDGYWLSEPNIMLNPTAISSCKDARMTDQKMTVRVAELEEFSPNRWRFKPEVVLSWLPGGSFTNQVNYRVSGSNETGYTPEYITSENCTQVKVDFQVSSKKNTETDGQLNQRLVDVYLYVDGQESGVTTVSLGTSTIYERGSVSSGVLSSGKHIVKIKVVGRDSGEVFTLHAQSFDYVAISTTENTTTSSTASPTITGDLETYDENTFFEARTRTYVNSVPTIISPAEKSGTITYEHTPVSPGTGWEVESHEFEVNAALSSIITYDNGGTGYSFIAVENGATYNHALREEAKEFILKTFSTSQSLRVVLNCHAKATYGGGDERIVMYLNVIGAGRITTKWRKTTTEIITTPITPNPFERTSAMLESVTETLGGDSQIAAGIVNYIAIGE